MTNSLTITYQALDLRDPSSRVVIEQALNGEAERSFYQSNGSLLPTDDLLKALNAFNNEDEAADLSLDELEGLSGGVGLPEALVSSTILMAMVSGACGCFANSMGAVSNSQIQDALNAGIHANIEQVRTDLANHDFNAAIGTYTPTAASGAIGQAFMNSSGYTDDNAAAGIQETLTIGGVEVIRDIQANGNSIEVTYTYTDDGGSASTVQSTSMVAPAAGWLS